MTTSNAPAGSTPPVITEASLPAQAEGLAEIGGNLRAAWRGWSLWTPSYGTHRLKIDWGVIEIDSTVVMEVCEISPSAGNTRFIGDAGLNIWGIAPGQGVVHFGVYIGWESPIPMRTDILVFN
ncbi:hypothetical protein GCM10010252_26260 [Streptomyces aureoverticillatus]|nr:hypothetical protein GCM10010252_26260 [Streptomyces aureoverticillatus]